MEQSPRTSIDALDAEFRKLHEESKALIKKVDKEILFREIGDSHKSMMPHSVGTFAIRAAAAVEQTINGITVRLWDDPFEWTLPEQLPTVEDLTAYFDEVEAARIRGFKFLSSDADLQKQIPAPVELKSLEQILTDTLKRSNQLLSEAMSNSSKIESSQAE